MTTPPDLPELYDALMTTRAMRRFRPYPVPDDVVEAILQAGVQAPSGGNIQPYQFLVVTDPTLRAAIGAVYLRAWQRYEPAVAAITPPFADPEAEAAHRRNWQASDDLARTIGDVPVHVLVLGARISMVVHDDEGPMEVGPVYASIYPAVQNLVLAARAFGLGTVLTTVFRVYEDEVRELLGIPERFEVLALLPMGHPTGRFGVARRRPASSLTSWNRYGERRR
jgi:nitroreductase